MKKIAFAFAFSLCLSFVSQAQNNIYATAGISITIGPPTYAPGPRGSIVAIDSASGFWWINYNRGSATAWMKLGHTLQQKSGCSAPASAPTKYQSWFVINSCAKPELYLWSGSAWICLNCISTVTTDATLAGDGSLLSPLKIAQQAATLNQVLKWNGTTWAPAADAGTTYTGGTGIDVTGTVITNTGDLSVVNELITDFGVSAGSLGVTDAGGTHNVVLTDIAPIQSGNAADFNQTGSVLSLDYANGQKATALVPGFLTAADWAAFNAKQAAGNYITALTGDVTATGPGSVAATIATGVVGPTQLASTAVTPGSYTNANVTVDADGRVTSAANGSGGATDLTYSGSSSPVTLNSSTGTDVTTTAGTGISLAATSGNMTITNSAPSLWTDGGSTTYLTATTDNAAIGTTTATRKIDVETADAETAAVAYQNRLIHSTSGTAGTGFGGGIEYMLENASGTNRVAATQEVTWSDAVNATEDATWTLNLIRAGTLTNALTTLSTGFFGIGATSAVTTSTKLGILNGDITITKTDATPVVIGAYFNGSVARGMRFEAANTSVTSAPNGYLFQLGSAFSLSHTSGAVAEVRIPLTFNPTSGNGTFQFLSIDNAVINQTGGASGITTGINISPTLTSAADWRALVISTAGNKGVYQTSSTPTNNFMGKTLFGGTGTPTSPVDVIAKFTGDGRTDQQGVTIQGPNIYAPLSTAYHLRFENTNGGSAYIGVDGGSVVRWRCEGFWTQQASGNQSFYYADRIIGFNAGYKILSNDATGFANHKTVVLGMRDNGTGLEYNLLTADPKGDAILITPYTATDIGLVVKGAASHTANLTEWRNSSGTVLGNVNASGDITAPKIISTATVRLKGYTVATLPTGVVGDMAYVTDALTPAYGVTVIGGGAVVTPVFFDGSTWTAR